MQGKKNQRRQLADILECRFLNEDSAGMVLDRIPQHQLLKLYRWFVHEEGGNSGGLLIDTAPILDTLVEIQAYLPPFFIEGFSGGEAGQGSSEDGEASSDENGERHRAEPGLDGYLSEKSAPGLDPEVAGASDMHSSDDSQAGSSRSARNDSSGSSPQMAAYGFFGCGLLWGACYLDTAVDSEGTAFPLEGRISDFLGYVSNKGFDHLASEKSEGEFTRIMSPAWLTQSLVALCPPLDIVLHSAYKLAKRSKEGAWEDNDDGAYLRFLFFLGLLVAGLKIPALSSRSGFSR